VVTDGTGTKADVPGYDVGGKTGTAEKAENGSYAHHLLISSFCGVFPIDDPQYLVFVLLDEPHGNKQTGGFATGGATAAPAVGRVIARIAPLLGVKRIDPTPMGLARPRRGKSLSSPQWNHNQKRVLSALGQAAIVTTGVQEFRGLAADSREVKPDSSLPRCRDQDRRRPFIADAVSRGAVAVLGAPEAAEQASTSASRSSPIQSAAAPAQTRRGVLRRAAACVRRGDRHQRQDIGCLIPAPNMGLSGPARRQPRHHRHRFPLRPCLARAHHAPIPCACTPSWRA
jgi:membrane peptidoglycan carboxypeptidase